MSDATILVKTRKGLEEMAHRTGTVPQKLRSVLILVDGKSRRADLLMISGGSRVKNGVMK